MEKQCKKILITGFPGIGKTTLIKKLGEKLTASNIKLNGFYTEELRNQQNTRIGFDIVTLDGKRAKLARTSNLLPPEETSRFKVGQYNVFPTNFESLALPLLDEVKQVLIIDEIGKMELFSDKFKNKVTDLFKTCHVPIIATIPMPKGKPIPLVEAIRNNPNSILFEVTRHNRDNLDEEILKIILDNINK